MVADVFIAIGLCLLTAFMAYLGMHVTLHAQTEPSAIWRFKIAFCTTAFCAMCLIGLQAYRAYSASFEMSQLIKEQGIEIRNEIAKENARPINITVPLPKSKGVPTPEPVGVTIEARKTLLRNKAVQLSAEILSFLGDRNRSGLQFFNLQNAGLNQNLSPEEFKKRWDAETKRTEDFRNETVTLYNSNFRERARNLLGEMKVAGIDVDRAWYVPASPEVIQKFATDLASVTRDIR